MVDHPFLRVRLALLYVTTSILSAVTTPFWPVYLASKGLDGPAIGLVLAATYFARPLFSPLAGMIIDRRGDYRVPLIVIGLLGAVTLALYGPVHGFVPLLLVALLASACSSALGAPQESLTLLCASRYRFQYGHVRLWGSTAFIVATSLSGWALVGRNDAALFPTALFGAALVAGSCWLIPDIRREGTPGRMPSLWPLLRNPAFVLFLAITCFNQGSHVVYYNYSSLHWRAAGLSGGLIGLLWSEGVVAEVLVFAFGARLERWLGPTGLLTLGGIAGVVRWTVLAFTTDPVALALIQWTHGLTFAASHLGAMYFIARAVPLGYSARAQGLYQSLSMGFAFAAASPIAGWLFAGFGGKAFLGCAILSAAGYAGSLILKSRWRGGSIFPPHPEPESPVFSPSAT